MHMPGSTTLARYDLGSFTVGRQVRLWIEAVAPSSSVGDQLIQVLIDPDGDGGAAPLMGVDSARVMAVDLDFNKIWSDQFPGIEANQAPDGTGYEGPDPANQTYVMRKPYILLGTRQDDRLYVKSQVSLTPDVPSVRNRLFVRLKSETGLILDEVSAPDGLQAGGTVDGNTFSLHTDSSWVVTGTNGNVRNDVRLVWGIDFDETGGMDDVETLGRASSYLRAVNQEVYDDAWDELRQYVIRGAWSGYDHSPNFLWAYLNDLGLSGAINYPTGGQLSPNEYKLVHNVGALFPASGPAMINKAVFTTTSGSSLASDLTTSFAFKQLYDSTLLANAQSIKDWFTANASATTHTFTEGFASTLDEVKFVAANGDADLNYALGDAVTAGVRIAPTVTKIVDSGDNVEYRTTSVAVTGTLTDLYDFDLDAPTPADFAAAVQAAYNGVNRLGGHVFKIEVVLGSTVNHVFGI